MWRRSSGNRSKCQSLKVIGTAGQAECIIVLMKVEELKEEKAALMFGTANDSTRSDLL